MKIGIEAHTIEKIEKLGAGGIYLSQILKEWSKLDPDQYQFVLYFKDRIPEDEFLKSRVFIKKIVRTPIKSTVLFYNIFMPIIAKRDKVDVLFLPFYMRPLICFTPTVVAIHDVSYRTHPEWFSWNYKLPFRLLTWLAIKKSKAILTCSNYTKKEIMNNYNVSESKIKVIYLAANDEFNVDKNKNENEILKSKQKYGINKKYLFFTGSIFNRRHVLETIKAFDLLLKQNLDYQLLISGRNLTNPFQDIDKEINIINRQFSDAIKRVQYVNEDDFKNIYQNAEMTIYLSEYEGFGLPVIEAMACGIPVLTTKMTSLEEVSGDYPIAIDDPNNINEIKEKIIKILGDEQLRKTMIAKGLERAKSFSWQKTAEETLRTLISN